jgi:hypothetical protein
MPVSRERSTCPPVCRRGTARWRPATTPSEVDGDRAQFDTRGGIVVWVGDSCLISAGSSPLGCTLADQRPESELRDEAVELARYVRKSIGCP